MPTPIFYRYAELAEHQRWKNNCLSGALNVSHGWNVIMVAE